MLDRAVMYVGAKKLLLKLLDSPTLPVTTAKDWIRPEDSPETGFARICNKLGVPRPLY